MAAGSNVGTSVTVSVTPKIAIPAAPALEVPDRDTCSACTRSTRRGLIWSKVLLIALKEVQVLFFLLFVHFFQNGWRK